jgi:hypothetical protein
VKSCDVSEFGLRPRFAVSDAFASRALTYAAQHATGRTFTAFGPATLKIEICGTVLGNIALDLLRYASIDSMETVDLHLVMIDGKDTGIDGPAFDDLALLRNGRKQREAISVQRSTLTMDDQWNTCRFLDADKRQAIVWIADAAAIPTWIIYHEILKILHWLSYERNFGLFHAAALRLGDVGCLITGKGGSGKSTITAAAIGRGFDTAGDDCVLVETTNTPRVHAIYDTIKLDDKSLARFPQLRPFICNPGRYAEDKEIVHLIDTGYNCFASGFPLHVIMHARLTGEQQSRIVESASPDAFRALALTSLMLLRAQGKQVSVNCAKLVGRLGTYAFEIGTDIDAAVAELTEFMRGVKQ